MKVKGDDVLDQMDGEGEDNTTPEKDSGEGFVESLELPLEPKSESNADDKEKSGEDSETPDAEKKKTGEEEPQQGDEEKSKGQEELNLDEDLPEETVKKLSKREQGMYRDLKKTRERAQEAEKERDYLKLQAKFGQRPASEETTEPPKDEPEAEDPLKDKADDDYLTAGEVRKIFAAKEAEENKKREEAIRQNQESARQAKAREAEIDAIETEFKKTHPDYERALNLAAQMIQKHEGLGIELAREANRKGGNPVAKVYEIGRLHPDFNKKAPAPSKPGNNVDKMIRNAEKQSTSASVTGSNGGGASTNYEGMDDQELAKSVAALSYAEFNRLPRAIRQRALQAA